MPLIRVLTFVLLLASVGQLALAESVERNLRTLCEGKEQVKITSVDHVHELTSQLDNEIYEGVCSQRVRQALKELDILIQDKLACSTQKANEIVDFYEKYIKKTFGVDKVGRDRKVADGAETVEVGSNGDEEEKLPKPLVDFVLAYGLKTSAICRQNMMDTFPRFALENLSTRDFEDVGRLIGRLSTLGRLINALAKPGEILLPVDVFRALPEINQENFILRQANAQELLRVKAICKERFEPAYVEILKPIAILARHGFDFRTIQMRANLWISPRLSFDVTEWTKIVFLCESMKTLNIVKDTEDSCKLHMQTFADGKEGEKTVNKPYRTSQVEPVETGAQYKPLVEIDGKIIGKTDLQLKRAIGQFDPTKTSVQRLEKEVAKNVWRIVLEKAWADAHSELLKEFIASIESCGPNPELDRAKKDLVDSVNTKYTSKLYSSAIVPNAVYKMLHWLVFMIVMIPTKIPSLPRTS